MKKILHHIPSADYNGVANQVLNIYKTIDRTKFQFILFCDNKEPDNKSFIHEIEGLGGKVIFSNINKWKNPFFYQNNIEYIIKSEKITIVQVHTPYSYLVLKAAKKMNLQKRILLVHGGMDFSTKALARFVFIKLASLYSTNRFTVSNQLTKIFGNKFETIYNGIDVKKFEFSEKDRYNIRKKLGIKENVFVVFQVGRFDDNKNQIWTLKCIQNMDQNSKENIKFLFVGKNQDLKPVKSMNLENHVIQIGESNEVEKFLSASDLLLMPSKYEGFPLSIIEASINGLKIIASNNISKEVNLFNNVDFLEISKKNSLRVWVDKILDYKRAFQSNPEKLNLPKTSEKFRQYFDIEYIISKWEELYG